MIVSIATCSGAVDHTITGAIPILVGAVVSKSRCFAVITIVHGGFAVQGIVAGIVAGGVSHTGHGIAAIDAVRAVFESTSHASVDAIATVPVCLNTFETGITQVVANPAGGFAGEVAGNDSRDHTAVVVRRFTIRANHGSFTVAAIPVGIYAFECSVAGVVARGVHRANTGAVDEAFRVIFQCARVARSNIAIAGIPVGTFALESGVATTVSKPSGHRVTITVTSDEADRTVVERTLGTDF